MRLSEGGQSELERWYLWLLAPLVLPICLVFMLPLGLLALLSIPFYLVFPDAHLHKYDYDGTPRQKELLARWRARYASLGIIRRIRRGAKLWRRGPTWRRREERIPKPSASMHPHNDPLHPLWDRLIDE